MCGSLDVKKVVFKEISKTQTEFHLQRKDISLQLNLFVVSHCWACMVEIE